VELEKNHLYQLSGDFAGRDLCPEIDTYDDHRMAMCFSLCAFGPKQIQINDPHCVAKTFPHYFSELASITH
jgi:5-enolpyruvylshikimate-3-phosphate synthase